MDTPENDRHWHELVSYNIGVLQQGAALIMRCADEGVAFSAFVGPHLRHIVEHYEAFVLAVAVRHARKPEGCAVHYDGRPRDRRFERDADYALQRIAALQAMLFALDHQALPGAVDIHLYGGLAGEQAFVTASSPERELMFLASHATHHFALVKTRLEQLGVVLGASFGQAPATVRHAIAQADTPIPLEATHAS